MRQILLSIGQVPTKAMHSVFFMAVFFPLLCFAQEAVIKGKITDSKTKETLIGVNVVLTDNTGVASDIDGNYELKIAEGQHTITYRFIGYTSQTRTVTAKSGETITLDVQLEPAVTQLDVVVVSAGKFEQKYEDITVSMDVVKPYLAENKNATSMEKVVQQAPGVQVVDNEVQIRGGSGYSFGAGSRVQILVDDLPLLSGDAGRPTWSMLPIENLEQIEVVKGASSVLYGSAALSGVINIRTAYPKDEPKTKINVYQGIYDNPKRTQAIWWDKDGTNPMYTGMNFFHSRKIKNLDLVIGGNLFNDNGYVGPEPTTEEIENIILRRRKYGPSSKNDSIFINGQYYVNAGGNDTTFTITPKFTTTEHNIGKFENRARMNVNLRYRSKKIEGLSYGVNVNSMYSRSATVLVMLDCDTGMYRSFPGAITRTLMSTYNIDPFITYFDASGNRHSLRTRYYYLDNNNNNNQANKSTLTYGEYQYQKTFQNIKNFTITSGVMGVYSHSIAPLYAANEDSSGISNASNVAGYFQLDKKFFEKLTFNMGLRGEYFKVNSVATQSDIDIGGKTLIKNLPFKPVFRSGLNYQLLRETYMRVSFGQGYRFPTIAEKYIRTGVGTMNIFPNLDIKEETSWNAEVAIKQGFKIGKFMGYLDIAYFRQEFENNIEFNFGYWGNTSIQTTIDAIDDSIAKNIGFRSINVGRTRVDGVDISLLGQGKIGEVTLTTLAGYTYMRPVALEPDYGYSRVNMDDSTFNTLIKPQGIIDSTILTYNNTSSDPTNNILKYRFQHLLKVDLEATYSKFSLGGSVRYNSFMQNVDKIFLVLDTGAVNLLPTGITQYRLDRYGKGTYVFDARFSYKINEKTKVAVIINNLLNKEYMIRPLVIESPRTFAIQYTMEF
jgi:outer membrane receptor protein involved in Fe transport